MRRREELDALQARPEFRIIDYNLQSGGASGLALNELTPGRSKLEHVYDRVDLLSYWPTSNPPPQKDLDREQEGSAGHLPWTGRTFEMVK